MYQWNVLFYRGYPGTTQGYQMGYSKIVRISRLSPQTSGRTFDPIPFSATSKCSLGDGSQGSRLQLIVTDFQPLKHDDKQ